MVVADLVRPGEHGAVKFLRKPAIHFAAIGALLYCVKVLAFAPALSAPEPDVLTIDAARVEELRSGWLERTGAPPDDRVLDGLIRTEIDDRLLVREARRRGLHRSDPVVQRRLLRNMGFLAGAAEASPDAQLEEAYRLGMDRSDLVVHRRLVQLIQLEAIGGARFPDPGEAELQAYLEQNADRFMQPERLHLHHVYFSRDTRGDSTFDDAAEALARIGDVEDPSGVADDAGDPFMFPRDLPSRSEREIARVLGGEFASRVFALPDGRWAGPVPSAYGAHLAFVHERVPATPPPLDVVRNEVRESLLAERGKRALRELLRTLRAAGPIVVEGRSTPAWEDG